MATPFNNFKMDQIFTIKYEAIQLLDEYKYYINKTRKTLANLITTNNNTLTWNSINAINKSPKMN